MKRQLLILALGCGVLAAAEQDWRIAAMERSNGVYSLHEAAEAGNIATLTARMKEGADINAKDEQGNTPLLLAVGGGHAEAAAALLEAGADPLAQNAEGQTPAELAPTTELEKLCRRGEAVRRQELELVAALEADDLSTVVNMLEEMGVNPDAMNADNTANALVIAVQKGYDDIVERLLAAGANPNAVMPNKLTALHVAAAAGQTKIADVLLKAGADPMAQAGNGSTPLHEAVWYRHAETVKVLLPAYKTCNYAPDARWLPAPVNMAITQDNPAIVKLICEAGYDPNAPRKGDDPALITAAKQQNAEMVQCLLSAGADKNLKDKDGKTAADYAEGAVRDLLR